MDNKLMQYIPQDDIFLFNTGNAQKAWLCFGCRYIPEIGLHRFLQSGGRVQRMGPVCHADGAHRGRRMGRLC